MSFLTISKCSRLLCLLRPARLGAGYLSSFSTDVHKADGSVVYDVVISGGGMVGTAMAASLASEPVFRGKRILLLEAEPKKCLKKPPENIQSRTCALSAATVRLLSSFGAWENIYKMRAQPVRHMQIWDSCANAVLTIHKHDDPLAYIVENDVIVTGIVQQLDTMLSDTVQVKYNSRVKSYKLSQMHEPWVEMVLDDGQSLRARLVIGADGLKSLVRRTANIHTVELDYHQLAVVATVKVSEDASNTTAWQRFLPSGPVALLPVSDNHSCLIWATDHDRAKELLKLSPESFVDAVNTAYTSEQYKNKLVESAEQLLESFRTSLGLRGAGRLEEQMRLPPTVIGVTENSRAAFPLSLCHSTHYVRDRVALIGDAAHRIHPLAGQGANLGFGDVICLRQHLVNAMQLGRDPGCIQHLLEYETERQRNAIPMIAFCDAVNRFYSNDNTAMIFLRNIGCDIAHSVTPIKDQMINIAMG